MKKVNLSKKYYLGEYNCAQSVVLTFADEINLSKEDLVKVSSGFGGGIAGFQKTCGALSGGVIVLNLLYDEDEKIEAIQDLFNKFEKLNSNLDCIDLIEIDFEKKDEMTEKEEKVKKEKCLGFVKDVVKIIEEMIS